MVLGLKTVDIRVAKTTLTTTAVRQMFALRADYVTADSFCEKDRPGT